jgi:hypothetical protein
MDEQALEARRLYFREWRKKNKEKVARYQADFWTRQMTTLEIRSLEEELEQLKKKA